MRLRNKDIQLDCTSLVQLKLQLNLYCCTNVKEQRVKAKETIQRIVVAKLKKSVIQSYDKQKLYNHFRRRNLIMSK